MTLLQKDFLGKLTSLKAKLTQIVPRVPKGAGFVLATLQIHIEYSSSCLKVPISFSSVQVIHKIELVTWGLESLILGVYREEGR